MNANLVKAIENVIADSTGETANIVGSRSTAGGCINQTEVIDLSGGRKFFLKTNSLAADGLFEREAEGLQAITAVDAINVPDVIGHGATSQTQFLVLQIIEPGPRQSDFFQQFGRQLASLHKHGVNASQQFGFDRNNYLGSTPQPNDWSDSWLEFWRTQRLGFQFQLARQNGLANSNFNNMADRLLDRLDDLIVVNEPPSLLHGDLWNGNFMRGRAGEPVLIDPAVYYGHREAEFGMTTLFGGFDEAFYSAYHETWPLQDGSDDRIEVYRLYHLLNHLNLFGSSYHAQCLEIMKKFA